MSSFSLESSQGVNTNLDTRAAVNTFPSNFGPEGTGDGSFCDWIPDGEAWQFQGYGENGLPRSLNGKLTDAHQVLGSNASASAPAAYKEEQDFYVGHDGGYMIPIQSKFGQEMGSHYEKLVGGYGMKDLTPVYLEKGALNFFLPEPRSEV